MLKDGSLVCESDLCPTDDLTGLVHEVQSANREGITFQLKSGALYYCVGDDWITDTSSVEAGIYDGILYRLTKKGVVMQDDEPYEMHVKHIVLTDQGVILIKEETETAGVGRLRVTMQQVEFGGYFRSPLAVSYTETI